MNGDRITSSQLKIIHTLIGKIGLRDAKEALVLDVSEGRTSSSRELTMREAMRLIRYLKAEAGDHGKAEAMRRKIIAMAHDMSWHLPGTKKVDMIRLDAWMIRYSYMKKKLDQYSEKELPLLVTQFERVYQSFLSGF